MLSLKLLNDSGVNNLIKNKFLKAKYLILLVIIFANMLRYLIIPLLPHFIFTNEEKRLALVIGNSNYDKGPLNNPVNDAVNGKDFDSLDFDVILDTNIANRGEFLKLLESLEVRGQIMMLLLCITQVMVFK